MPNNKHPAFCAWCTVRKKGSSLCENAIQGKHGIIKGCKVKDIIKWHGNQHITVSVK